jgi:hypothetical protein
MHLYASYINNKRSPAYSCDIIRGTDAPQTTCFVSRILRDPIADMVSVETMVPCPL